VVVVVVVVEKEEEEEDDSEVIFIYRRLLAEREYTIILFSIQQVGLQGRFILYTRKDMT